MMLIFSVFVVAIFSFFLTWLLRRYALVKSIIDIPNARSSHSIPTPRGGGVAIVISFLASLPFLYFAGQLDLSVMYALLCTGFGIALLGFLDDHGHIAAGWRLLGHLMASIWFLFWLGGLPAVVFFGYKIHLMWIGDVLAAVYLIWMLNLYNFMDGIDGIASIEAICVCLCGAFLYYYLGYSTAAILPILLAASIIGFLCWNFPPAKIFMGDAGSGFLGFILAGLSLQAAWIAPQLLWSWIILLGVFIVDATLTLLRRLIRREKVYEAHRSHAYQYAARHYYAHKPVTLVVGIINILWLFPWAFMVAILKVDGAVAMLIAFAPLILLAVKFNAGTEEKSL